MPGTPQRRSDAIPHPADLVGGRDHQIGLTELIRPYRARRGNPCLLCGGTTECFILPDPQRPDLRHVYCTRAADYPNARHWAGFGFKADGVWYVPYTDDAAMPRRTPSTQRPNFHPAPLEVQDRILRKIAAYFGLNDAHRARLAARGYDPDRCGPDGPYLFASLPADVYARYRVVNELIAHCETWADVIGVYGVAVKRRLANSPTFFLPDVPSAALIEFCVDANGLVWGFQYAPDTPEVDAKGKAKKRLSPVGLRIAEQYHCTIPPDDDGAHLWHTEGIHKTNLVAAHQHAPAVASLGAGNLRGLVAAANDLDPHRRRRHIIALDADMPEKAQEIAQTLHEQGFTVAVAQWDGSVAKGPDDALLARLPITTPFYAPKGQGRMLRSVQHVYPWQRNPETSSARGAHLAALVAQMQRDVVAHIRARNPKVLVVIAPPGVGKSTTIAPLASTFNLAWIAQRHNMVGSNPHLHDPLFRHIETATATTCPDGHKLHRALVEKGYLTEPAHDHHGATCAYRLQWDMQWPSIYQLNHVDTPFPAGHEAEILDECEVASWLPAQRITVGQIHATNNRFPASSTPSLFLTALQSILTDFGQAHEADRTAPLPSGAAIFDALQARLGGHLPALLAQMDKAFPPRPHPPSDVTLDNPLGVARAEGLPKVVLPQIIAALLAELPRWEKGEAFNSRLRIGRYGHEMAYYLTIPHHFTPSEDHMIPPRVLLDATADPSLLSRLWDASVTVKRYEIEPPPHTRHIAVRTGKRYGKRALTGPSQNHNRARVVAELRYLLRDLDPDGALRQAERVGLITYADCEEALGEALGIPSHRRMHFWATRGSNDLEACDLLLVVGTPTLSEIEIVRMAEALYWHEVKINPGWLTDEEGHRRYVDPRCQALSDYLTNAELTQCAHRNRPLRHDGRVVVTLGMGTIDFLPATTTITNLPHLTTDGEERRTKRLVEAEARISTVVSALEEAGTVVTVREVARRARVQCAVANAALRRLRYREVAVARAFPETPYDLGAKSETPLRIVPPLPLAAPLISPPVQPPCPFGERLRHWTAAGVGEDEAIATIIREREVFAGVG